jgi:DNA modification methylase
MKCSAWRGNFGNEPSLTDYIRHMVSIFDEVKRVLRDDGISWLNLGDSFAKKWMGDSKILLKDKDVCFVPHRVAIALQDSGWYVRNDVVWAKSGFLPESTKSRCTKSKEYIFLLTKEPSYFYDVDAIREPCTWIENRPSGMERQAAQYREKVKHNGEHPEIGGSGTGFVGHSGTVKADGTPLNHPVGKNKRDVWFYKPAQFKDAHFAVFPPELIEPCIKAGASEKGCCAACGAPYRRVLKKVGEFQRRWGKGNMGGSPYNKQSSMQNLYEMSHWEKTCECDTDEIIPTVVMDIFMGSGTTGLVARSYKRSFVGIELSEKYAEMASERLKSEWYNQKDDSKSTKRKNKIKDDSQPVFDLMWEDEDEGGDGSA